MVSGGANAIFAPGATLNDGNVVIVGSDAAGAVLAGEYRRDFIRRHD